MFLGGYLEGLSEAFWSLGRPFGRLRCLLEVVAFNEHSSERQALFNAYDWSKMYSDRKTPYCWMLSTFCVEKSSTKRASYSSMPGIAARLQVLGQHYTLECLELSAFRIVPGCTIWRGFCTRAQAWTLVECQLLSNFNYQTHAFTKNVEPPPIITFQCFSFDVRNLHLCSKIYSSRRASSCSMPRTML